MDESILQTKNMMVVILIQLRVQLERVLALHKGLHRGGLLTKSKTETSIIL